MLEYPHSPRPPDTLSLIGNIAGIASLVLAVAGNNLTALSTLQRWGLSGASAVMLWAFLFGLLVEQMKPHWHWRNYNGLRVFAIFLFGGWIGAGLLLAILPFFAFGLPAETHNYVSITAAISFGPAPRSCCRQVHRPWIRADVAVRCRRAARWRSRAGRCRRRCRRWRCVHCVSTGSCRS